MLRKSKHTGYDSLIGATHSAQTEPENAMDYEEACEATVTKREALRELKRHGADAAEFFADVGEKDEYLGAEVLDWLGY